MGKFKHSFLTTLLMLLGLGACVSRQQVAEEYGQNIRLNYGDQYGDQATRPQTLVFILMDGLSVPLLQKLFSEKRAPHIRQFFLGNSKTFQLARATFPSLTHVNISSIITSRNVDTQPIIGNKILRDGKIIDLESPFSQKTFAELLQPYSVFTELSQQGRTSMSFAPFYGDQATGRYGLDLKMGMAYRSGDYAYVDGEILQSTLYSLNHVPLDKWPELIFIHIIGIDAKEHHSGHLSPETIEYAQWIDTKLAPLFAILNEASKKGRHVGAVMTSDHGMSDLKNVVQVDEAVAKFAPGSTAINQGRFLTLNFAAQSSPQERHQSLKAISKLTGVEMTIERQQDKLRILTPTRELQLRYRSADCGRDGDYEVSIESQSFLCPSKLNRVSRNFFYPYFATNVAAYFKAKDAPDALILAQEQTSFGDAIHAHHGGLTPDEITVPLLVWNLKVKTTERLPPTFRLLEDFRSKASK